MAVAAEAAGTAYRYHPHAADVVACRSMAFPPPRAGSSSSSCPYSSRSADTFSPAPFSAPNGVLLQQLDVLDYFSDDGGTSAVPGTFDTPLQLPPRVPIKAPIVPDVGGYFTAHPRSTAVAAGTTDKIAFRTRSKEEVLDDGYKWRKYGKKSVKNSPNPRNYYRCTTEECSVKKRVERDRDDANYVLTMYEGIHNHASPGTVYYAAQDAASGRFFVAGTYLSGP